jgi:hypothetical protein
MFPYLQNFYLKLFIAHSSRITLSYWISVWKKMLVIVITEWRSSQRKSRRKGGSNVVCWGNLRTATARPDGFPLHCLRQQVSVQFHLFVARHRHNPASSLDHQILKDLAVGVSELGTHKILKVCIFTHPSIYEFFAPKFISLTHWYSNFFLGVPPDVTLYPQSNWCIIQVIHSL